MISSKDVENIGESLSPIIFRAATRVIEKIAGHSLSLDSAFQETLAEFNLGFEAQRVVYLLSKRTLENIGVPIYMLKRNNRQDLPLRRKAAFYLAFYLTARMGISTGRIKAIRGGLLSDSLLSMLSPRSIDKALEEVKGQPLPLRLAHLESVPPLIVSSLLSRFDEKSVWRILRSLRQRHVWVRVNNFEMTNEIAEYLREKGVQVKPDKDFPFLLEITDLTEAPLPRLPEGLAMYQDKASVVAVEAFLSANPGAVIIDLAAAPCMKASLICFRKKPEDLILIDISEKRTKACREIMSRAPCDHEVINADGRLFSSPRAFGGAVVDAPCTNSGAISKDPGLRLTLWDLSKSDLERYKNVQSSLLSNALSLVKPGAPVLYSTCSIFSEEGEEVLETIRINYHTRTPRLPAQLEKNIHETCDGCYRLFPHIHRTDGFFFTVVSRDE